jgi:hypothetical protein
MATNRVTFFFQSSVYGWSETWWITGNDLVSIRTPIENYLGLRMAMLPQNMTCNGVRWAIEGQARKGRILLPPNAELADKVWMSIPRNGTAPIGGEFAPDQMRACLQLEVLVGNQRLSTRYFLPAPDAVVETEPASLILSQAPNWFSAFNKWRNQVLADGWMVKGIQGAGGALEKSIVTWATQDAPPNFLTVTVPNLLLLPIAEETSVIVRGVRMVRRGLESPNGTWVVHSATANVTPVNTQTVVLRLASGFDPSTFKTLGKIRLKEAVYVKPDRLFLLRAGVHKRGGPFGRSAGRRLTRARGR